LYLVDEGDDSWWWDDEGGDWVWWWHVEAGWIDAENSWPPGFTACRFIEMSSERMNRQSETEAGM
jgi:hypothetical protein